MNRQKRLGESRQHFDPFPLVLKLRKPSMRISFLEHSSWRHKSQAGLTYQQTTVGASDRGRNFLLLASRFPLQIEPSAGLLNSSGRWLHAVVRGVNLMLMHVPNRSDAKWQFHDDVITQLSRFESGRAIAMGDTNTGQPGLDEESKFFYRKEGAWLENCLLYTSPSPRDQRGSRMPSSA